MKHSTFVCMLATAIVFGALLAWAPAGHTAGIEPIALPGTGDSQDILRALARDYTTRYPDRQVSVPNSIGSDGGVRVVGTGESPIGRIARLPNGEEIAKYGEFSYIEFARVPVVFVVTSQAGVRNLTEQQICDVFSGRVANWKHVGGNDVPIDVQSRPDGSNNQTIRKHIACFRNLEVAPNAHFNLSNSDLVNSMKTFPGAIGFMPLSEAVLYGYQAVTIDGVGATAPGYKLGIGLGFVHKNKLSAGIQSFLDYLETEPAREIMRTSGHVPVTR